MNCGISWKMVLAFKSMVLKWCMTESLSHLLKKRFGDNIIEYEVSWLMLYLIMSISKSSINPLLRPSLNPYVIHMKVINKFRKPRPIFWFRNICFLRWRKMKTLKPCFLDFKFLCLVFKWWTKFYTTSDHVKKILRSLPFKFRPKVIAIQEAKDLNILSLESLINNLQSHEM